MCQVPLIPPAFGVQFEGGYTIEKHPITQGMRLVPPPKGGEGRQGQAGEGREEREAGRRGQGGEGGRGREERPLREL